MLKLDWLDKRCFMKIKSKKFNLVESHLDTVGEVTVCTGEITYFFMFLSPLSPIMFSFSPTFELKVSMQSCRWALSFSEFKRRKKCLSPISFVKGLLQDETCPCLGFFFEFFFFIPRTHELMLPGCLPAWTRGRRNCRHSSGARRHHQPISCWNVDPE